MNILQNFPSSSIGAWVCLICGFISVIAFIYAILTRPKVELGYQIETKNAISLKKSTSNKIKLLYDGKPIKDLYITKILFQNKGREIIDNALMTIDPLGVTYSEGITVLDTNCDAPEINQISVNHNDKDRKIVISIGDKGFLEKKESFTVQIIHTGYPNKDVFKLCGKLKKCKFVQLKKTSSILFYIFCFTPLITLCGLMLYIEIRYKSVLSYFDKILFSDPIVIICMIIALISIFFLYILVIIRMINRIKNIFKNGSIKIFLY